MRLFILTMAFATLAGNSRAEDPIRTVAELEPIVSAIQQPKPDFEAGGFRVDMPAGKIKEQAIANGYTNTLYFTGKTIAMVDGKSLATDDYDSRLDFFKLSEDKAKKEIVVLKLLPGQGGLSSISQHVEFQYRAGQTHRTRQEVEAELIAKYGRASTTVEKLKTSGAKFTIVHALGLYCFATDGTAMTALDTCNIEKAHADGYSYDIELDERGDVVSFDVEYDAGSYAKSYMDALSDKMDAIIENDQKPWWQIW